jgi:capsular polysaccharide biosynthesis protein
MYEMDEKYLKMFSRLLSKLKANFRFIKTDESTNIVADNFYTQTTLNDDVNPGNAVYDLCRKFIITEVVKPFRKVYLSRKSMGNRDYEDTFVDGPSFKNDNRIDNEEILENFFTSIGFEVVSPDIKFETFEDQVKFFYETETLVHLTGGGGTNAIFMQPRSNIVELVTTMVVNNNTREDGMKDSEEALHHFYSAYAFNKDHNYISIQNKSRKATDIVNKINNDKLLSAIFERITT